jgi:alpha-tubulin suppressor-like RCC1 family protein
MNSVIKKIIGFANGIKHAIEITEKSEKYIWGDNYLGQLRNRAEN